MVFIDILIYWIIDLIFPAEKTSSKNQRSHTQYDATSLLVADSLLRDNRNDDGRPKTFNDSDNDDPFLNEDYSDGPDW